MSGKDDQKATRCGYDAAKVFGATSAKIKITKVKILIKILFPLALPQIFSGLKISIAISIILGITVEMIVGGGGLGYFILDAERSFQFKNMYSGILVIGLIGYVISYFINKLEKWIIYW